MTAWARYAVLAAVLGVCGLAGAQMFPGEPAPATTGPATMPKPVVIHTPEVDKEHHRVTLPAAFWNEKLTNWVEVGMCGRPSDFLHETIICVTTTKAKLMAAMRQVGFVDADAWVGNVADFPRVRGDRVMMLLEVERDGKKEIYPLDELLAFQGWGTSIGPFGWMFKGDPEREKAEPTTERPDEKKTDLTPREQIMRDDPQVALQFKGLQHLSRSFIDHPLCYDDWIFPNFRYFRNYTLLPEKVYDSNGDVPVKLILQKVGEAEFLRAMAKYWHDAKFGEYALKQLPVAEQIDADKAELLKAVPAVRKKAELLRTVDDGAAQLTDSDEFRKVAVLAAAIEKNYAVLDAAWTQWNCDHTKWTTNDPGEIKELEGQRKLWREHMELKRQRAEQLWRAETAMSKIRELKRQKPSEELKLALRKASGQEVEARSLATLAENKQVLDYWRYEKSRLAPDDPRKDWRRHIDVQLELSLAKEEMSKLGVALGKALQESRNEKELETTQAAYQKLVLKTMLAGLRVQLADVEFEVSKREGLDNDPDLPGLVKKREALRNQIKEAEAATQPAK